MNTTKTFMAMSFQEIFTVMNTAEIFIFLCLLFCLLVVATLLGDWVGTRIVRLLERLGRK